jgi:hypothetical protein
LGILQFNDLRSVYSAFPAPCHALQLRTAVLFFIIRRQRVFNREIKVLASVFALRVVVKAGGVMSDTLERLRESLQLVLPFPFPASVLLVLLLFKFLESLP